MKATWRFGFTTSSPSTCTSPSDAGSRPEPLFSRVLLPQPDGPISESTSPSLMESVTSSTDTPPPPSRGLGKRLVPLPQPHRGAGGVAGLQAGYRQHERLG